MSTLPEFNTINEITSYLRVVDRRLRTQEVLQGMSWGIVLIVGMVMIALLADYLLGLPSFIRVSLLTLLVVASLYAFWKLVMTPLFKRRPDDELAWYLDRAYPHLKEGVTSLIEFERMDSQQKSGHYSPLMLEMSLKATTKGLRNENIALPNVIPADFMWKALWSAVIMGVLLLLPAFFFRHSYSQLMTRFFAPLVNIGTVTNLQFDVQPGDTILARGSSLKIVAVPRWAIKKEPVTNTVYLEWTDAQGVSQNRIVDYDSSSDSYQTTLGQLKESLSYRILCGTTASPVYTLKVVDPPLVINQSLEVNPPSYLGFPSTMHETFPQKLVVNEGSRCEYKVVFNQAVESADFLMNPVDLDTESIIQPGMAAPNGADPAKDLTERLPLVLAEDHLSGTVNLDVTKSVICSFDLKGASGLSLGDQHRHLLYVIPDDAPSLRVFASEKPTSVRSQDEVRIRLIAQDDVSIKDIMLELVISQKNGESEKTIHAPPEILGKDLVEHTFVLKLPELKLAHGDIIVYRIRAQDGCEIPAPHEVWSERYVFMIDDEKGSASREEVAQQQEDVRKFLAKLIEDTNREQKVLNDLQDRSHSAERNNQPFGDPDTLQVVRQEVKHTIRETEQLSKMVSTLPLYKSMQATLQEVFEKDLQKSWDEMQNVDALQPVQLTPKLNQSKLSIQTAHQKLSKLLESFEQTASLEKDLAELNDLARDVQKLAQESSLLDQLDQEMARKTEPQLNQAESSNAEPGTGSPDKSKANSPNMPADEANLSDRDQLQKEVNQATQKLDDLMKKRPELIQAAKEFQLERLAQISQMSKLLAEREKKLSESLAEDQNRQRQEIQNLVGQAHDVANHARPLEELQQGLTTKMDLPAFDSDILAEAVQEMEKGNTGASLEKLKQAQKDLHDLAAALEKNKKLSSDPQQRMQELAAREKQVAESLKQLKDNGPPADQTQTEALHKLGMEQAAIENALANTPVDKRLQPDQEKTAQDMQQALHHLEDGKVNESLDRAQKANDKLNQLAKRFGTAEDRLHRTQNEVKDLQKQQAAIQSKLQEMKDKPAPESDEQKQQLEEERKKQLEDLAKKETEISKKIAGIEAEHAKQDMLQAEQKSKEALQEMNNKNLDNSQRKSQELSDSLQKLSDKLQDQAAAEKFAKEQQAKADAPHQVPGQQPQIAQQTQEDAVKFNEIMQKQYEINNNTNQQLHNQKDREHQLKKIANQQRDLSEAMNKLTPQAGQIDMAKAHKNMEASKQALEAGDMAQAKSAQDAVLKNIEQVKKNLQVQSWSGIQAPAEIERRTKELNQKLDKLTNELAQKVNPQQSKPENPLANADKPDQPQANQTAAPNGEQKNGEEMPVKPADQQMTEQSPPAVGTNIPQLLEKQREITRRSADLAVKTAREVGNDSPAAKQLKNMAMESDNASQNADVGRFEQAQQKAQAVAQKANEAQQSLIGDETEAGLRKQKLADDIQALAKDQQALQQQYQSMQKDNQAKGDAQQYSQQRLTDMTEKIQQSLGDIEQELQKNPINDSKGSKNAQQTKSTAGEAKSQMDSAHQALQGQNKGDARDSTKNAADLLEKLSMQADLAAGRSSSTTIPAEAGKDVVDASEKLKQAQQKANPQSANKQQPSKQGKKGSEKAQADNSQGKSDEETLTEMLANASDALQNATDRLRKQSGKESESQMSGEASNESKDGNTGESMGGDGSGRNNPFVDLTRIEAQFQHMSQKNWGRLPGQMETEILQSTRKKPHTEYTMQVKRYFENLAGQKPATNYAPAPDTQSPERADGLPQQQKR
jgi:hypothetical protein